MKDKLLHDLLEDMRADTSDMQLPEAKNRKAFDLINQIRDLHYKWVMLVESEPEEKDWTEK